MKAKFVFILIIIVHFGSTAQVKSFEGFKTQLKAVQKDSIGVAFDKRLQELAKVRADSQTINQTLELKFEIADSLSDMKLKLEAALELSNYINYQSDNNKFTYLISAGDAENKKGNFDVGTSYLYQALKIAEKLKNDTLKANVYYKLGYSFMKADNTPVAQKYLRASIKTNIILKDSTTLSGNYMTYGNIHKNSGVHDSALYFYHKSLEIAKIIDFKRNIAGNYNNIGNVYRIQGKYNKAIEFYERAVEMNKVSGNKTWLSYNYNNLGVTYNTLKNYNKALDYYKESLVIKDELNANASKISTYENISDIYEKKGNYKLAYENLRLAEELRETYKNDDKLNLTATLEAKFQNEKKEALVKQLKAEQELQDIILASQQKKFELQSKVKAKHRKMLLVMTVVIVFLVLAIVLFWRNANQKKKHVRILHKKNNEIRTVNNDLQSAQKVLTKKNNEITDSITYAKRIQAAILPSQNLLKATLENAFVLYLPKDIVAGDFYWTEQVGDTTLFAVADCTGHGVPGAMVSVICNSALTASIKNEGLTEPGKILDHTTQIVLSQFSKAEEEVKDGMDIALCAYNKKDRVLSYAGANIPLWLIREGEVIEIKATRQPVGKHVIQQPFKTNQIQINPGDVIYLSSDGFADQFGGRRNKKYMKKNFKKLLVEVSEKSIVQQNAEINTVFIDWKAENEQVDDICVMGIRIN